MNMINTKQLKKELTISQIINLLEVLGSKVYSQSSNYIIFYSCCHHLDCLQHKPKLYYYLDTCSFFCYSCTTSFDIYSLIEERWSLESRQFVFVDIVNYIIQTLHLDYQQFQRVNVSAQTKSTWRNILGKYDRIQSTETSLPCWDRKILNCFDKIYPIEWINEGISIETMQQFNIRYYKLFNQTIIPCFDVDNNLIGIRVRNWKPNIAKYTSLYTISDYTNSNKEGTNFKFNTHRVLYGLNFNKYAIEHQKKVILTESEKAVMKGHTWYGHKNITVAMLGSFLNERRKRMILAYEPEEIIIVPDYDYHDIESWEKWVKKQKKLGKMFKNLCKVSIVLNENDIVPYKNNAFDVTQNKFEYLMERRFNMYE